MKVFEGIVDCVVVDVVVEVGDCGMGFVVIVVDFVCFEVVVVFLNVFDV